MSNDFIVSANNSKIVVDSNPIVVHESFYVVNGKNVKATFDLSEIDPKYHELIARKIQSGGVNIVTPK